MNILDHALSDNVASNPNLLPDGNFGVWYEALSHSTYGYGSATMWKVNGSNHSFTLSRQDFISDRLDIPHAPQYYARMDVSSAGQGADDNLHLTGPVEGVRSLSKGNAVLSFWARSGVEGAKLGTELYFYMGSDPGLSDDLPGIGATAHTLSTAWRKYVTVIDVPDTRELVLDYTGPDHIAANFWFSSNSGTASRSGGIGTQTGTFDIAHVKLETGAVATDGGWLEWPETLLRINRYFEECIASGEVRLASSTSVNATYKFPVNFAVPKRNVPTVRLIYGGASSGSVFAIEPSNLSNVGFAHRFSCNAEQLFYVNGAIYHADSRY